MDLAQLEAYLQVAEHRNFSRAAQALGLSQPSVPAGSPARPGAPLGMCGYSRWSVARTSAPSSNLIWGPVSTVAEMWS